MLRWDGRGPGTHRERRAYPRVESRMTIFDVECEPRDVLFALLALPLVLVGLWAGMALLFAVAG